MIDFKGEAPANADFATNIPADAEDKEFVAEAFGVSIERIRQLNTKAQSYKPKTAVEAIQVATHIAATPAELIYLSYSIGYEDGVDPMRGLAHLMKAADGKA